MRRLATLLQGEDAAFAAESDQLEAGAFDGRLEAEREEAALAIPGLDRREIRQHARLIEGAAAAEEVVRAGLQEAVERLLGRGLATFEADALQAALEVQGHEIVDDASDLGVVATASGLALQHPMQEAHLGERVAARAQLGGERVDPADRLVALERAALAKGQGVVPIAELGPPPGYVARGVGVGPFVRDGRVGRVGPAEGERVAAFAREVALPDAHDPAGVGRDRDGDLAGGLVGGLDGDLRALETGGLESLSQALTDLAFDDAGPHVADAEADEALEATLVDGRAGESVGVLAARVHVARDDLFDARAAAFLDHELEVDVGLVDARCDHLDLHAVEAGLAIEALERLDLALDLLVVEGAVGIDRERRAGAQEHALQEVLAAERVVAGDAHAPHERHRLDREHERAVGAFVDAHEARADRQPGLVEATA